MCYGYPGTLTKTLGFRVAILAMSLSIKFPLDSHIFTCANLSCFQNFMCWMGEDENVAFTYHILIIAFSFCSLQVKVPVSHCQYLR